MKPSRPSGSHSAQVVLAAVDGRTALGCARSLRAAGVPFAVVCQGPADVLRASNALAGRWVATTPSGSTSVDMIVETAQRTGARLVLPTYDGALAALSARRAELEAAGIVVAASTAESVRNILDKRAHLETARAVGVPCPPQHDLRDLSELPEAAARIGFPMVVKASSATAREIPHKWVVVHDLVELRRYLEAHCASGPFPLLQARAQGTLVGLYCLAHRGEIVALLAQRAIRRMGGENVYRVVIAPPRALVGHTERLLRRLEWNGLAALSFFVDAAGNALYMEMNGRPWGTIGAQVRIGWDFPVWAVRYHGDGELPRPPQPRLGQRGCWRWADLMGVIAVARGEAWLTDRDHDSVARRAWAYLAAFRPGVTSDVFRWNDPLPELAEHVKWLRTTNWYARQGRRLDRIRRGRRARYDCPP